MEVLELICGRTLHFGPSSRANCASACPLRIQCFCFDEQLINPGIEETLSICYVDADMAIMGHEDGSSI